MIRKSQPWASISSLAPAARFGLTATGACSARKQWLVADMLAAS